MVRGEEGRVRTDEGDTLDGLSEAHLVGQDAVVVLHPGVDEPVEALQLVVAQLPRAQEVRLLQQRTLPLTGAPLGLQPTHALYQPRLPLLHKSLTHSRLVPSTEGLIRCLTETVSVSTRHTIQTLTHMLGDVTQIHLPEGLHHCWEHMCPASPHKPDDDSRVDACLLVLSSIQVDAPQKMQQVVQTGHC